MIPVYYQSLHITLRTHVLAHVKFRCLCSVLLQPFFVPHQDSVTQSRRVEEREVVRIDLDLMSTGTEAS
jgi:hypothetical protein